MVYLLGLSNDQFQPFRKPWAIGLANRLNLKTLPRHADQILVAAGVYQGIFSILSPLVSSYLIPERYSKWDERTRINWNTRVVSFVQAVFICAKALAVIVGDPSRKTATAEQRLWGYSTAAGEVQAWAAGYFLWDVYVSSRYMTQTGWAGLAHAVCALTVTLIGFVSIFCAYEVSFILLMSGQRPFANYYGVNFVLYELSTPFLNVHWSCDKFDLTGSNLQLYNGFALMTTFFGSRLVWGTYQTWLLSKDMLTAWRAGPVPSVLFSTYLLANTSLTCLNFYWFGKMVDAMRKRFQTKESRG